MCSERNIDTTRSNHIIASINIMEILSTNDGLLTNIEVLEIIKENQNKIIDNKLTFNNNLQNKDHVENQVC